MGLGVHLTTIFGKDYIYIFVAFSFIMFLFLSLLFCHSLIRCYQPWTQMKDIQGEAILKIMVMFLSSYKYWRCICLQLSVCESLSVPIHQGVIRNYFWQQKSILIASFGTDTICLVPFWSIAPSPASLIFILFFLFNIYRLIWSYELLSLSGRNLVSPYVFFLWINLLHVMPKSWK